MSTETPYIIYSESTPNPAVMKFVANKILVNQSKECLNIQETEDATLLRKLFSFPFVKELFISGNYISIKKHDAVEWSEITNSVRIFIQGELNNDVKISGEKSTKSPHIMKEKSDVISRVEKVLDLTIRPNIQMDGGDLELISLKNKVLKIFLKGACNGCPSSHITLKNGVEVLLKKEFPNEITEVIAINN